MEELDGRKAYEQLQKLLNEKGKSLHVMERQVDIDVQMTYMKHSLKAKKNLPEIESVIEDSKNLSNDDIDLEEKKLLLSKLASFGNVKTFRILEAYMKNPSADLNEWSYMAYQESLTLLESSLMNEERVSISSGMGGKENKLRYFVVFMSNDMKREFREEEQQLIFNELKYQFEKSNAELEENSFHLSYFMFSCLIPIEENIADLFSNITSEVNQFGKVLHEKFLVTNVKKLEISEIDKFIEDKIKNDE
jgi:hypothetical protein